MSTRRWLTLLLAAAALVGALLFSRRIGTSGRGAANTSTSSYPPSGGHPGAIHGSKTNDVLQGTDADEKLERTILPAYYDDRRAWIAVMKGAISKCASLFNSHRMMRRYAVDSYLH